jgi:hypothetical protein
MHPSLRLVTVLLAAVMGTAAAQEPMPTVSKPPAIIRTLKAHEVVEQVLGQQHDLLLSPAQLEDLTALHKAVKEERAIYEATGRTRPPEKRAVWITTPEQALAKAYTILTPQQQHKSLMLFEQRSKKPQ